jgi:hypothetical protein
MVCVTRHVTYIIQMQDDMSYSRIIPDFQIYNTCQIKSSYGGENTLSYLNIPTFEQAFQTFFHIQ